jgi:hypothetical protein
MIDKIVATGDFRGIREGQLVRVLVSYPFLSIREDAIGIVIGKTLIPRTLDPECCETYDPMVFVVSGGNRACLPVDDVEILE